MYGIGPMMSSTGEPNCFERRDDSCRPRRGPRIQASAMPQACCPSGAVMSTAAATSSSGRRPHEVGVERQHCVRVRKRMHDQSADDQRPDRMQPVLERRDDAEIAAAAAERPEQIGMSRRAGAHQLAVWRARRRRAMQVVHRHADVPSSQPKPPPSVRPAMPVSPTVPPVVARPNACVSRSNSSTSRPVRRATVRAAGSTRIAFMSQKSITRPSSHVAASGDAVPAAADRDRQMLRRARSSRRR